MVSSLPSWASLPMSWPKYSFDQLKMVDTTYAIELCNVVGPPLFIHVWGRRGIAPTAEKFLIALHLAAAIQCNLEAIAALGRVRAANLPNLFCFDIATNPKDQSYKSFTILSRYDWFNKGCADI